MANTGLRHLTLCENALEVLPAGPYLANLERLMPWIEALPQLPSALTAATGLTCLEVRDSTAALSSAGMAAVLSRLPRLRRLQLVFCGLDALPPAGWHGIAALQYLHLGVNQLTSLPAALHQATSLLQLNLSGNMQLAPTAEQLGALLSRLPLLEGLDLTGLGLMELPSHMPPGKLHPPGARCTA